MTKNANEYSLSLKSGLLLALSVLAGCGSPTPESTPTPLLSSMPSPVIPEQLPHPLASERSPQPKSRVFTGSLRPVQGVRVTSRNAGRILAVSVREGDAIITRQELCRLDTRELDAQLRVADAAISAAEAQVAQAKAAYRQQHVVSETGTATARAMLASAEAQLSQTRSGARPQEIQQADAQLQIALTNAHKAEEDYDRYERLSRAGAVAPVDVEQYRTARDIARQQVKAQTEALSLLQAGARSQEIVQGEQSVRQARENLRQAIAARTQIELRQSEIQVAFALLKQRKNERLLVQEALTDAVVVAPFSGKITKRAAEAGQRIAADEELFHLVSDAVYLELSVPETELNHFRTNQSVTVTIDAFPGQRLTGRVTRLGAISQSAGRSVSVRIDFSGTPPTALRPGMFARVTLRTNNAGKGGN